MKCKHLTVDRYVSSGLAFERCVDCGEFWEYRASLPKGITPVVSYESRDKR